MKIKVLIFTLINIKKLWIIEKFIDIHTLPSGWQATVAAAPMLGYLPGGLVFGTLSDKFGRKPTFLICNMVR